jgi:hypothetical protein
VASKRNKLRRTLVGILFRKLWSRIEGGGGAGLSWLRIGAGGELL